MAADLSYVQSHICWMCVQSLLQSFSGATPKRSRQCRLDLYAASLRAEIVPAEVIAEWHGNCLTILEEIRHPSPETFDRGLQTVSRKEQEESFLKIKIHGTSLCTQTVLQGPPLPYCTGE